MSATPRTDAGTFYMNDDNFSAVVNRALAMSLETELAESKAEAERLKIQAGDRNDWQDVAMKVSVERDSLLLQLREARANAFEEAADLVALSYEFGKHKDAAMLRREADRIRKGLE